ncbi:MAG: TlpA disulfide reductase family protein [Candidatus Dormiibacterota bacterium]
MRRLVALGAAGVCLVACGSAHAAAKPAAVTASGGPTLTGKDVSITSFHGHPVVLIFWASWCGPCHDEQPELNSADEKWSARGVEFLGVDLRDDTKDALAFQSKLKVPYPSIADTQATLAVDYRVPSAPALVFLDAQGKVADVVLGALGTMSVADFNTELTLLLGAQSASA